MNEERLLKDLVVEDWLTFKGVGDTNTTVTVGYNADDVKLAYSIDKGKTWYEIKSGETTDSAKVIYIGGRSFGGLYKNNNHGLSWTVSAPTECSGNLSALSMRKWSLKEWIPSDPPRWTHIELPLLHPYGFASMFKGCTNLVTAPNIYGSNTGAYKETFKGCSNLVSTEIKRIILTDAHSEDGEEYKEIFSGMFEGCSKLEKAPKIYVDFTYGMTGLENMFVNMFKGCKKLTSVTLIDPWATNLDVKNYTGWLDGITTSGELVIKNTTPNFPPDPWNPDTFWTFGDINIELPETWKKKLIANWGVNIITPPAKPEEPDTGIGEILETIPKNFLTFTGENMSIVPNFTNENVELAYSMNDGKVWHRIDAKTETPKGKKILFAGICPNEWGEIGLFERVDSSNAWVLNADDNIEITGNIMSLLMSSFDDEVPPTDFSPFANLSMSYMFYNCKKLAKAPELPAMQVATLQYKSMFEGCSSLTSAPDLPATELAEYCYSSMFFGCSNLTNAPILPAIELEDGCYSGMFSGCELLTSITLGYTGTDASLFYGWLEGIETTGTLFKSGKPFEEEDLEWILPATWIQITDEPDIPDYLTFEGENLSIIPNFTDPTVELRYSMDEGKTWTNINAKEETPVGTKIMFKGISANTRLFTSSANTNAWILKATGNVSASGNIMYLVMSDFGDQEQQAKGRMLFRNTNAGMPPTSFNTEVIDGPTTDVMPMMVMMSSMEEETTPEQVSTYAFAYMFNGCTKLTTAPDLPATTLATYCYSRMFYGCTNLTSAPDLPATTLANNCYAYMFNGCTKLTTAPDLPATTLAIICYANMFNGCTKLTTAPDLPATTLAHSCYYSMFGGCTNLTTAPDLPATTLATSCYYSMFYGCSKLTSITLHYTGVDTSYFTDWIKPITTTGTLYKAGEQFPAPATNTYPATWTQVQI